MSQDAGLVVVSGLFAYFHAAHVVVDGSYTSLFFAIEQAILVVLFLGRRRSTATSTRPFDWVTATLGGWLPLATQPVGDGLGLATVSGSLIQVAGLSLTIVSFLTLGKSFGVVAANRGLKVHGPYRVVRHPIYLSHTVTQIGFLVANYHPLNFTILAAVWICQLLRIRAEERVLTETADYATYRGRVRWRLIPGLY
jgi:protein-S-isoprenylcysteine O-methyltransferase Ste14